MRDFSKLTLFRDGRLVVIIAQMCVRFRIMNNAVGLSMDTF